MATIVKLKDSRSWEKSNGGKSAEREYVVIRDSAADETFSYAGVPDVGDIHPSLTGLVAESVSFKEGSGRDKCIVTATVKYSPETNETIGSGETAQTCQVTQWGWDAGTEEKDMLMDQDGVAVMNSAGDLYATSPRYSTYAPTFTKVMKFKVRQQGALSYNCKVNDAQITIGGQQFPIGSLMISVTEKRILPADGKYKYEYQVQMKYRSNLVKIAQAQNAVDIGWDTAVTDAGMREKVDADGSLRLIRVMDQETGQMCKVTSPELLDGLGHAIARSASSTPTPYNFRYKTYARVSVPSWFYSEPS